MKFTKEQVKQIIKEEIEKYIFEDRHVTATAILGTEYTPPEMANKPLDISPEALEAISSHAEKTALEKIEGSDLKSEEEIIASLKETMKRMKSFAEYYEEHEREKQKNPVKPIDRRKDIEQLEQEIKELNRELQALQIDGTFNMIEKKREELDSKEKALAIKMGFLPDDGEDETSEGLAATIDAIKGLDQLAGEVESIKLPAKQKFNKVAIQNRIRKIFSIFKRK